MSPFASRGTGLSHRPRASVPLGAPAAWNPVRDEPTAPRASGSPPGKIDLPPTRRFFRSINARGPPASRLPFLASPSDLGQWQQQGTQLLWFQALTPVTPPCTALHSAQGSQTAVGQGRAGSGRPWSQTRSLRCRDKATCPRSPSWSQPVRSRGWPCAFILSSWTRTFGKTRAPNRPPAALCPRAQRGWQDPPLCRQHSVTLDKSLSLAGPQFPSYKWAQVPRPGKHRVHTSALALLVPSVPRCKGGRAIGLPGTGPNLPSPTGASGLFLGALLKIASSWPISSQEVSTSNWNWPQTGGEGREGLRGQPGGLMACLPPHLCHVSAV